MQRAVGRVAVRCHARDGGSHLKSHVQSGSLKALFPRPVSAGFDTVLLNTAGGITGGDRFSFELNVEDQALMTATSQAAERIYATHTPDAGRFEMNAKIGAGARLNWLPQETIIFDKSKLQRSLMVEMAPDAAFLCAETLIFGRSAMREVVRQGSLTDTWRIRRGDDLIFADALKMSGDVAAHLDKPAIANGNRAISSVLFVSPCADRKLQGAREILRDAGGASLVRAGVLFVRAMAADGFELRKTLIPLLEWLSDHPIPKTWRL